MALKASIEKLEDIPAPFREHYKKIDLADGKVTFQLDVEKVGGLELADTGGLLSSLEKERSNGAKLQRYGTITPEEARANSERIAKLVDELEALKKNKPGKLGDDERAQITNEMNKVHSEALAREKSMSDARLREIVRIRREEAAERALAEAGFKSAAKILKPHLMDQIEVLEDPEAKDPAGRFRVVVRSDSGGERQYIDPDTKQSRAMTPLDRAREMAKDNDFRPYLDASPKAPAASASSSSASATASSNTPRPGSALGSATERLRAALSQTSNAAP